MLAAAAAILLSAGAAGAADLVRKAPAAAPPPPPPPFDVAFGAGIMTDYNFRGITQSAHNPAVTMYVEPRYNITSNIQIYAGFGGSSISFPNRAAAEIDFYGGIRPTFGAFTIDLGVWYYYYPGGQTFNGLGPFFGGGTFTTSTSCTNGFGVTTPVFGGPFCNVLKGNVSFWEVYAKPSFVVNDMITVGANLFYSPSWLNSGASGTYGSVTLKLTAPATMLGKGWGAYASGELGNYWFGTTDSFYCTIACPAGIKYPNYVTWNLGVGVTYGPFTLDGRYYSTNLSTDNCNVLTGDHTASFTGGAAITPNNPSGLTSNWCGNAFIGKFSVDTTLNALKQ
jgi:hypothetical protein